MCACRVSPQAVVEEERPGLAVELRELRLLCRTNHGPSQLGQGGPLGIKALRSKIFWNTGVSKQVGSFLGFWFGSIAASVLGRSL